MECMEFGWRIYDGSMIKFEMDNIMAGGGGMSDSVVIQ